MNKSRRFEIAFIILFFLEFFLLEGYGSYPFPEAFIPLIFINAKDKNLIIKAFLIGLMMDLSTNNIGIFSFSYSIYSLILIFVMGYIIEIWYIDILLFLIYDIAIKFTNILLIYIKYNAYNVELSTILLSIFIDFIIFLLLKKFCIRA